MEPNPYSTPDPETAVVTQFGSPTKGRGSAIVGVPAIAVGTGFAILTLSVFHNNAILAVGLAGWVMLPYLILAFAAFRTTHVPSIVLLVLAGTALAIYGAWSIVVGYGDAQGGLWFFFGPAVQVLGALIAAFVVAVVDQFSSYRRRAAENNEFAP